MPHASFDAEEPPTEPPRGADPLIWRLALALRSDHSHLDAQGCCASCQQRWPCRLHIVAQQGLTLAVQRPGPLAEP